MASIDEEKAVHYATNETQSGHAGSDKTVSDEPAVIEYCSIPVKQDNGIFSRLRNLEARLDRAIGVEAQAIDRVRPEDKKPQPWHSQAVMCLLWASGTLQISCFATGFLGSEYFGLNLSDTIAITVFGTLLGGMVSGFCATMGPAMGLRQISISRYSFGWYPSKLIALLNTISQLGWSSVSCITGGLALSAVSGGRVSTALGVVIIAVGSLIVSFIGLRAVLATDKYAWFVFLILFLVLYGEAAPYASFATPPTEDGTPLTAVQRSAGALNLLAIVYGSSASWASCAADYYVHYPVDTSRTKVFLLTTLGITAPTALAMSLGCVVGSAFSTTRTDWGETNEKDGVGYLLLQILHPEGWAKFSVVILMFSGITCNCINMYSAALSIQQFTRYAAIIPRFLWSIVVFGIVLGIGLAGRDKLLTVLENLLALLGYWSTSFFVIISIEHFWFRKGSFSSYNLEAWNNPAKLPLGLAGLGAFLIGFVGWLMGMVTTWYSGPIAKLIAGGGDLGNELSLAFTFISYVPLRHLELKYFGR